MRRVALPFVLTGCLLGAFLFAAHRITLARHSARRAPDGPVSLRIDKSRYLLTVLDSHGAYRVYPVVFGRNPVQDKLREGDGCTPEGHFRIRDMYPHKAWTWFLWLDYPTADSRRKHEQAKRDGRIKRTAAIGGEIGIHGVPVGQDSLIASRTNWTLGCISLKTKDIQELASLASRGTPVEIVH